MLLTLGYGADARVLWVALTLDVALAVVALFDWLSPPPVVEAERQHPSIVSVGRAFEVQLTLRSDTSRPREVYLRDECAGETVGLPTTLMLQPDGGHRCTYQASFKTRGAYSFGDVVVRVASPLGLWWRQQSLCVPGQLSVYPDFSFMRSADMRSAVSSARAPVRARRKRGGENEFQRNRAYVAGDSYRHIDWKATARRQRFITREFGQESNQNVLFLIDAGRSMTAKIGELTAFDHALNAALAMGDAALRHGDRVGILVFDREVRRWLPPRGGARSAQRLIRGTYDVFPSLEEPDYAGAFRYMSGRLRQRSLVVLMTAVVDGVNADLASTVVSALGRRHLPLCVWMRDHEVDALVDAPPDGTDATFFSRCAAADWASWRGQMLADLSRQGALVVDCHPQELSSSLLSRYLELKARRVL